MYKCDECQDESNHSQYPIPAIIHSGDGKRIVHIECCSQDNLIEEIKQMVEGEQIFYSDVSKLLQNFNLQNLEKFEKKYGTYNETKWGIQIDKFVQILAMIDHLKNKKKLRK